MANRREVRKGVSRFRGIARHTAILSTGIEFEDDQNGRHKVSGEWQIRKGLARAASIVASGQSVLRLREFVAQGDNGMVVAFRGNGDLVAAPTPTEGWS